MSSEYFFIFYIILGTNAITYRGAPKLVSEKRMQDAVDIMLGMQNPNGGFASYELIRGPSWLEWLNPAEVFGKLLANVSLQLSEPNCHPQVTS